MMIDLIVGTRPNFIKIFSLINVLRNTSSIGDLSYRLVHTGQHFDDNMSKLFFSDLDLPVPDFFLDCGGGTHAEQTSKIMVSYEKILLNTSVDLVIVVGDVNSTMGCAIVAKKLYKKVAHIEAGIRSNDLKMPEEINRLITDSISDYFFTTSEYANNNLLASGVDKNKIFYVGNTMIDALLHYKNKFRKPEFWDDFNLSIKNYFVLTIHRPSNLESKNDLKEMLTLINNNSKGYKVIFPVHPRTSESVNEINLNLDNLLMINPLSYLEFNYLVDNSLGVITDSGGISEETTVLGIPCITLRDSTERPETVEVGSNVLVGSSLYRLKIYMQKIIKGDWKTSQKPELWDGKTGLRIIEILKDISLV